MKGEQMTITASVPRYWMTTEQEEVLRVLGVSDPLTDEIPDDVLDLLDESMNAAGSDWEREEFSLLLTALEADL